MNAWAFVPLGAPFTLKQKVDSCQENYFGKRVEVTGYYMAGFEYSGLYETKQDSEGFRVSSKRFGGRTHNGLWIMPFAKPGYEDRIRPIKEGVVRVIGTFRYNREDPDLGVGHINGWPAEMISLELFEGLQ